MAFRYVGLDIINELFQKCLVNITNSLSVMKRFIEIRPTNYSPKLSRNFPHIYGKP